MRLILVDHPGTSQRAGSTSAVPRGARDCSFTGKEEADTEGLHGAFAAGRREPDTEQRSSWSCWDGLERVGSLGREVTSPLPPGP